MRPPTSPSFLRLLQFSAMALMLTVVLCTVCYYFVDRPVAFFVRDHRLFQAELSRMTEPPPLVQSWTPLLLAGLCISRAFGPFSRWQRALLAAAVGLIVADQFRESLRDVFGRTWPETWIHGNPSLIRDGVFGFHFFHSGDAYGSFPSGHAARTAAVAAAVWMFAPRWRWASGLMFAAEGAALVGMNYHFVSDVLAGGAVGAIVGAYCCMFCLPDDEISATSRPLLAVESQDRSV